MPIDPEQRRQALRDFMEARGLKPYPWAKKAGVSEGTIRNFLKNKAESLTEQTYRKLAVAAGASVRQLTGEEDGVDLVGFAGAGAEVHLIKEDSDIVYDKVEAPPDVNPDTVVAVTVRGDSLMPAFQDGSLLYYRRTQLGVPDDCIGKLCVVEDFDGRCWVKFLHRGYLANQFNLHNVSSSFMEDVPVKWASRVLWIKPA